MNAVRTSITVGVVLCGVAGDALQGVDAANAHVKLVGAELLDRLRVAVGHLPFAGQGEVPRGIYERTGCEQPGGQCQQPAPRIVPCALE